MTCSNLVKLSYSSSVLLSNCEERYRHYKVLSTPVDSDFNEDKEYLIMGKAFHSILEGTLHTKNNLREVIATVISSYKLDETQECILTAMVLKYLKLHDKSKMTLIKCELQIESDDFIGYIDAVMEDDYGRWWIVDLKTCKTLGSTVVQRLTSDFQLNLYSSFFPQVAEKLNLLPLLFAGARYRTTTKPSLIRKKTEERIDYIKRLNESCKSFDIEIPLSLMKLSAAKERHEMLHRKAVELHSGARKAAQNFSYCDSFFKPCPYWSKCHGEIFSKSGDELKIESEL